MNGSSVVKVDVEQILQVCQSEFDDLAGSRVLLTGGAGFLGYYFCHAFAAYNSIARSPIEVLVVDRFVHGVPEWISNLSADTTTMLTVVEGDISEALPSRFEDFDYAIHAASIASPTFYRRYPIETIEANVFGLRHILERWRQRGRTEGKLLFFSSSEIYGDPEEIPTSETCRGRVSCTGPRACYDESKRFGETLAVNYSRVHRVPVVTVRPFNNYGPGLRLGDRRVIPDFAENILKGHDIEVFSDGSPTRTFCYVSDAIGGYIKALVHGRPGEAYNIGVETPEVAIGELAKLMTAIAADCLGYRGKVVFQTSEATEYLTDNPSRRCPNIGKARRELKYFPQISLADGLRRSLYWYRDSGA